MIEKTRDKLLKAPLCWSFPALLFISGCGDSSKTGSTDADLERFALVQKIELLQSQGKPVLVVGGETVTSDDIINTPIEIKDMYISPREYLAPTALTNTLEQFKERARGHIESALSARISDILLYKLAKEQAGQQAQEVLDKMAESDLRRFALRFGGDQSKADEALKKMGLNSDSFKQRRKRMILAQSYIATNLREDRPITYSELIDCYNKIKDEMFVTPATIQFRLIDIEIAKVELSDPNMSRVEQARRLADNLVERIKTGEDFGQLAEQYSHGHMRASGGLWKPIDPDSLAKPYDVLAIEAEKLNPGQTAGPIETNSHIFIMKLEDKHPKDYEPFEKVQRQLEERVLVERRLKAIEKFNAKLMQQVQSNQKDEFVDYCLEEIYRQESGVRSQETEDRR